MPPTPPTKRGRGRINVSHAATRNQEGMAMETLSCILLFRAFNNGRSPQTDRIECDLVAPMTQGEDVEFACILAKIDGIPTVERIVKGTWRSPCHQTSIEAAQEILG